METLNDLIKLCGVKKEFLICTTGINRTKFYKGLKDWSVFNDNDLNNIALALGYNRKVIDNIINARNQASGLHH